MTKIPFSKLGHFEAHPKADKRGVQGGELAGPAISGQLCCMSTVKCRTDGIIQSWSSSFRVFLNPVGVDFTTPPPLSEHNKANGSAIGIEAFANPPTGPY